MHCKITLIVSVTVIIVYKGLLLVSSKQNNPVRFFLYTWDQIQGLRISRSQKKKKKSTTYWCIVNSLDYCVSPIHPLWPYFDSEHTFLHSFVFGFHTVCYSHSKRRHHPRISKPILLLLLNDDLFTTGILDILPLDERTDVLVIQHCLSLKRGIVWQYLISKANFFWSLCLFSQENSVTKQIHIERTKSKTPDCPFICWHAIIF